MKFFVAVVAMVGLYFIIKSLGIGSSIAFVLLGATFTWSLLLFLLGAGIIMKLLVLD
jgi:hypothetical protein